MEDNAKYYFLHNKNFQKTGIITLIIAFIIVVAIEWFYPVHSRLPPLLSHQNRCYLQIIPIMLLTSLAGNLFGMILVLTYFAFACFFFNNLPYYVFVFLCASLIANIPIVFRWYKSIWKTMLFMILAPLILGNGWQFLSIILDGRRINLNSEFFHFIVALPSCIIVSLVNFCFQNFVPNHIQSKFFTSTFNSESLRILRKEISKKKGRRISVKMTRMIVIEALVLTISGFGFANGLLSEINIFYGWEGAIFATRLTILMTIIAVPVVCFCDFQITIKIRNPLMLMAKSVEDENLAIFEGEENKKSRFPIDIRSLGIKSKDEIGILYETLVASFNATSQYINNLEKSQLLETQLATAKAANKAKTDFVSNMSHEIRTPINAVLGLNEMIIRESKEKGTLKYAHDIENAGKSLLNIVNDILDFSKIEAGKLEIIPSDYNISVAVNDVINMISKRAENKHLDFIVDVDKEIPCLLYGDDVRLKQCIINILTNAVKYTNEGSVKLTISGKKVDYSHIQITVHVVDTGIGIKDKDIPKLFTAFQRIEEERNRTIEGTGLGLNIVQSLLSLMNSRLEVNSVYGQGSDFYFSVLQGVIDWEPIGDYRESYQKSLDETTGYHELFKAPSARILVVDDTELNLTVVKGLLKQTEIQVDTAVSGYDTLDLVKENKYDVILLDHRMPGMDGVETFEKMKTLEGNLNVGVPVIALTANAVSGAKEMYLSKGFRDYMSKPIEGKNLEALLVKYIPKEKITYEEIKEDSADEIVELEELSADEEEGKFSKLTGISIADGLKYTGGAEVLEQAIKEFYANIDKKAGQIEEFYNQKDWRNYTILVHALKSSARLIGAEKLSEDAKHLEKCGDEENVEEISQKTPALLELYRSYKEHLAPLCAEKEDDSAKEEMPLDQYKEALSNIGECVQAYDYDTADQIIAMMKDYKIPEEKKENFAALCDAVSAVDHDRILEIVLK